MSPTTNPDAPAISGSMRSAISRRTSVLAFVGLTSLLFIARFCLLTRAMFVSPEECHTGGIAAEVLRHGFQFPLPSYSPEHYENGIIVEGLLAIPFFQTLGQNVLSLKLLAFAVSVIGVAMSLALLRRLLESSRDRTRVATWAAFAAFAVMQLAPPAAYFRKTVDALGDHHEGSVLSLILLVLLFRRQERPSWSRFVLLWLLAGAFVAWEKGTGVVVALAALNELLMSRRWIERGARLGLAMLLAGIGYAPAFLVAYESSLRDWSDVLGKFAGSGGGHPLKTFADLIWAFCEQRVAWLVIFVGALIWLFSNVRRSPATGLARWLSAYAVIQLVMLSLTSPEELNLDYAQYLFPVVMVSAAWGFGRLVDAVSPRVGIRWAGAFATLTIVLALATIPTHSFWKPDLALLRDLHTDRNSATCYWRFGRAFSNAQPSDPNQAIEWCRKLGGDAALSCISGIPFGSAHGTSALASKLDQPELLALAFGSGRLWVEDSETEQSCDRAFSSDSGAQKSCAAGRRWECLVYSNMLSLIMEGRGLKQPVCDATPRWQSGQMASAIGKLNDPRGGTTAGSGALSRLAGEQGPCHQVMQECYAGR